MKLVALTVLAALLVAPVAVRAQEHHHDGAAAMPAHKPVPPSKSLNITVEGRTTNLTIEDLTELPQHTVHVHNAHSDADENYTGPLLADVFAKAGLVANRETEHLLLHSAVIATGTDNYYVVYSAAEAMPAFGKGQVIVAIMKAGLPDTEGSLIQLINDTDKKPSRWVHGLQNLNLMTVNQNH